MPDRNPHLNLPQHLLPRALPGSPGSWQAKKRGSIKRSHNPYPGGKLLWRTSKTESQSIHVPHTEMFRDLGWSCRAETRLDDGLSINVLVRPTRGLVDLVFPLSLLDCLRLPSGHLDGPRVPGTSD
ncbi:hypothetical protein E4U54_007010 [Claviceps lovelessii]|nr:hypothetical protein E4U54_007010 [Claviceps lovelessii]